MMTEPVRRPIGRRFFLPYYVYMQRSAQVLGIVILVLALVAGIVWWALASASTAGKLTVTFLDVGQGDAILIESPSGVQVLIDGGKNRAVIRELSREMPLFDRSIDAVIATHPDADHIGGLVDVLARYKVALVGLSSVEDAEGDDMKAFSRAIAHEEASVITLERGQVIDIGGGAQLEILFPDRTVPDIETNTGSVIARLVYGSTSFMLTGDSPSAIEEYLVQIDGNSLAADVLKAGHHGSRTSSSLIFVGYVSPEFAVISRGCDNTYGHPHAEVLATFARLEIPTLDTCEEGSITFVSDGVSVRRR